MKQLLYIPNAVIVNFKINGNLISLEEYTAYRKITDEIVIDKIVQQKFQAFFYRRNKIYRNAIKEEFMVIETTTCQSK